MTSATNAIQTAAEGLLFISESEAPLTLITIPDTVDSVANHLKLLAGTESEIETQTLDYFLRNATRAGQTGEEEATAVRFRQLKEVLETHLKNIVVYRIGTVQVHAFIIGELPDGGYAGLRTLLIET